MAGCLTVFWKRSFRAVAITDIEKISVYQTMKFALYVVFYKKYYEKIIVM